MAQRFTPDPGDALPVRAGYLATALAILGAVAVSLVVGAWVAPAPTTVAAALGLDDAEDPALERRRAIAVARQTGSCMAEQGFTYLAIPAPAPDIPDADLDPVAWAGRWGFGISTAVGGTASIHPDPNAQRAVGLDPATRDRYERSLHGRDGVPGCLTRATEAVFGLRERLLSPLRTDLVALDRAIEADPGMTAIREAWRSCVGPSLVAVGIEPDVIDRSRLPSQVTAAVIARLEQDRNDPTRLAGLQAAERRVAVDLARCEIRFAAGRALVASPHESTFVREHGAELDRIGTAIREAEDRLGDAPTP